VIVAQRHDVINSTRSSFETSVVLGLPESGLGGSRVTATVGTLVLIAGLRVINRRRL
jgi:hypothetical protein